MNIYRFIHCAPFMQNALFCGSSWSAFTFYVIIPRALPGATIFKPFQGWILPYCKIRRKPVKLCRDELPLIRIHSIEATSSFTRLWHWSIASLDNKVKRGYANIKTATPLSKLCNIAPFLSESSLCTSYVCTSIKKGPIITNFVV